MKRKGEGGERRRRRRLGLEIRTIKPLPSSPLPGRYSSPHTRTVPIENYVARTPYVPDMYERVQNEIVGSYPKRQEGDRVSLRCQSLQLRAEEKKHQSHHRPIVLPRFHRSSSLSSPISISALSAHFLARVARRRERRCFCRAVHLSDSKAAQIRSSASCSLNDIVATSLERREEADSGILSRAGNMPRGESSDREEADSAVERSPETERRNAKRKDHS